MDSATTAVAGNCHPWFRLLKAALRTLDGNCITFALCGVFIFFGKEGHCGNMSSSLVDLASQGKSCERKNPLAGEPAVGFCKNGEQVNQIRKL